MKQQIQDNGREMAQIDLFDLIETKGRSNKYLHDATLNLNGKQFRIELKTSDTEKGLVSTSRVVNLDKLDEYVRLWWIFSKYYKKDCAVQGFDFTGEHYLMFGEELKPWLDKQRNRIREGSKTYAGTNDWDLLKSKVSESFPQDTLDRLEYSFYKYGASLNDPRINWKDVENYGHKIDPKRPAEHLRELILEVDNGNTPEERHTQGTLWHTQ